MPSKSADVRLRRVFVHVMKDYGFGLQFLRGAQRFRRTRPNWLFVRGIPMEVELLHPQSLGGALGHFCDAASEIEPLRAAGLEHIVSSSNRTQGLPVHYAVNDDRQIGRLAAEYFLGRGFRHFAIIEMKETYFSTLRSRGFRERLAEAGVGAVHRLLTRDHAWILDHADLYPLALFVVSDRAAQSVMNRLLVAGVRIPQDVAVLGVDDDEIMAPFCAVPLSSVKLDGERIGYAACETLERLMNGEAVPEVQMFPSPGIAERESTDALAVTDPLIRRAQAYMDEHLVTLTDIQALADALHVHRRTLDRAFREATGATPFDWLTRRRVKLAERLLLDTDFTMEVVAERAGFGEYERMLRGFRKAGRPLPSQVRKGGE
jgi:LacI family transcriptional regulator